MYPKIENRHWGPRIDVPVPTAFDGSIQKITTKEILQTAIERLENEADFSFKLTAFFCIIPLILLFAAIKFHWGFWAIFIIALVGVLFAYIFIRSHNDSEKEHQEIEDNAKLENLSFAIKSCSDKISEIDHNSDYYNDVQFQLSFSEEEYRVKEDVYHKTNIGDNFAFCYIGNKLVAAYPLTMWEIEGLDNLVQK